MHVFFFELFHVSVRLHHQASIRNSAEQPTLGTRFASFFAAFFSLFFIAFTPIPEPSTPMGSRSLLALDGFNLIFFFKVLAPSTAEFFRLDHGSHPDWYHFPRDAFQVEPVLLQQPHTILCYSAYLSVVHSHVTTWCLTLSKVSVVRYLYRPGATSGLFPSSHSSLSNTDP